MAPLWVQARAQPLREHQGHARDKPPVPLGKLHVAHENDGPSDRSSSISIEQGSSAGLEVPKLTAWSIPAGWWLPKSPF